VAEDGVGSVESAGFEHVECADGVDIEVVEWSFGGEVVTGLGGGVDDDVELLAFHDRHYGGAVADVECLMAEVFAGAFEALAVPGGVAFGAEEVGSHVVVDAQDAEAHLIEEDDGFRTDETTAASDKNSHENLVENQYDPKQMDVVYRPFRAIATKT